MKESDFIGQMVQETIQTSEESEHKVLDFTLHVERTIHLQYDQARMCHVITSKGKILEIPQNWGPFNNRISHEIYLQANDDKYEFLEILNQFFGEDFQAIKLVTSPMIKYFSGSNAA